MEFQRVAHERRQINTASVFYFGACGFIGMTIYQPVWGQVAIVLALVGYLFARRVPHERT